MGYECIGAFCVEERVLGGEAEQVSIRKKEQRHGAHLGKILIALFVVVLVDEVRLHA